MYIILGSFDFPEPSPGCPVQGFCQGFCGSCPGLCFMRNFLVSGPVRNSAEAGAGVSGP